jgi:hypothetical protein
VQRALCRHRQNYQEAIDLAGMEATWRMLLLAYSGDPGVAALIDELQLRLCLAGQEDQIGSWYAGMVMIETAALLGLRERCASPYPCALQLSKVGTMVVWNLGLTEKIAGIAAATGGEWQRTTSKKLESRPTGWETCWTWRNSCAGAHSRCYGATFKTTVNRRSGC